MAGFQSCRMAGNDLALIPALCLGFGAKLLQLEQGLDEGKCRFGTLVFIQTIDVQPIPAAAGLGVVYRHADGIPAEEPLKCLVGCSCTS